MSKTFTTTTSIKITKYEKTKKTMMILMYISYHLSKSLIIHAFDMIQFSHFATNSLSIYAINVEKVRQFIKTTRKKRFRQKFYSIQQ